MNVRRTAQRLVRGLARRTPRRVKRLVPPVLSRRLRKLAKSPKPRKKPILSVIIPVYNVAAYLPAALDSVLGQTLKGLEILVVDDGSTDECPQIIADYASRYKRIRAFHQENAGQGPARNLAVRQARGRFITFMDADDIIPPDAYAYMVKSLQKTGSDFSVGAAKRIQNGRLSSPIWNGPVHDRDRFGITIDDYPPALLDVIACNRMFRKSFWVEKVGDYRGGIAYEDHVPMVVAYVRATSFDLLAKTTYHWRIREDLTSTGQQKHDVSNLKDRVEVKEEAWRILEVEASPSVQAAWIGRVLDTDFPPYIEHALVANDEYRNILANAFSYYRTMADAQAMSHVRLLQKIRGYLASERAWDQLEPIQRHFREGGSPPPTYVQDARVYAGEHLSELVSTGLPADVRELGNSETGLRSCLQRVEWMDSSHLRLAGWSYIKNVDFGDEQPDIQLWLSHASTGERVDLQVQPWHTDEATRWSGQRHANCDTAGFSVVIDMAELTTDDESVGDWQLGVKVTMRGVSRDGAIHHAVLGSSATGGNLRSRVFAPEGTQAVPRYDSAAGFVVSIRRAVVTATQLDVLHEGRLATGRVRSEDAEDFEPLSIRITDRATQKSVQAPLESNDDGTYTFQVEVPPETSLEGEARPTSEWEVRVVSTRGVVRLLEWPLGTDHTRQSATADRRAYWARSPRGFVRLVLDSDDLLVTAVSVTEQGIQLTVKPGQLSSRQFATVRLMNSRLEVPMAGNEVLADGQVVWTFANTFSEFGLPARPLPSGGYWVELTDGNGIVQRLGSADELHQALPLDHNTLTHRIRISTGQNQLRIYLAAPLAGSERGNFAQTKLIDRYQNAQVEPEMAAFFQCYRGETATDSQLAIHHGLRESRPDMLLYWGVLDHSTVLPEGAVPLLIGSAAWYEKLASATYLSNNIDFDSFFRKRPHQRYLQTFHGYPFKSMGKSFWIGKGLPDDRIAYECRRRSEAWDAIVVPAEFCVDLYRREYDYPGEVLVTGYPRSDVLLSDARHEIRKRVRQGLQLSDDQTVVLYAPTYRDTLTTRTYAAKRFDALDLDQLSQQLSESFVILLRGHNNNQREPERVRGRAQIVDVTDYPEINDLTIAADVAVLDYSSLRFDWAVTGKPMVFFVPDEEDYFALRPPLFPYDQTTPGPRLTTTEEVIDALQNVDAVAADHAADLARFNAEYNQMHDGQATTRVLKSFFTLS